MLEGHVTATTIVDVKPKPMEGKPATFSQKSVMANTSADA